MAFDHGEMVGRWELARSAAIRAGEVIRPYFQAVDLGVENKQDGSPVTRADREAELFLREQISSRYPADAIVGEEFGEQPGTSGWCWVLDPVDGTKSFVAGVPLFGTMVGVTFEGAPVVGAIWFPPLQEGMDAAVGEGSWRVTADGRRERARVSQRARLDESVLLTTCDRELARRIGNDRWRALVESVRVVRTWGDVYGYMLVATGRAEAMVDPVMNVWDAAAVQPIVREAGGAFTDWQGVDRIDGGDSIGSNGLVHDQVLCGLRV